MTPEDRDRRIATAEELKRQKTRETCLRVVVSFQGREWAPGHTMRSRHFIVNVPKDWGDFHDDFQRAKAYVCDATRFPQFHEMVVGGKHEPARVGRILSYEYRNCEEIT